MQGINPELSLITAAIIVFQLIKTTALYFTVFSFCKYKKICWIFFVVVVVVVHMQ